MKIKQKSRNLKLFSLISAAGADWLSRGDKKKQQAPKSLQQRPVTSVLAAEPRSYSGFLGFIRTELAVVGRRSSLAKWR